MKRVLLVSVVLFVIACCLPALELTGKPDGPVMWGANILAVGWSGIFVGLIAWYANPFWMLGLVLAFFGKPKLGAAAGVVAIVIGCTTFYWFGKTLPADEGNVTHMTLTRMLPGGYVWFASLVTLPVCGFLKGKGSR